MTDSAGPPLTTPTRPLRIALLGAESTGKSTLAAEITAALIRRGHSCAAVPEVLREWCETEGRTPRRDEQATIAHEQARQALAPVDVDFVIADTTPLMTAVYSQLLFDDDALIAFALAHQQHYHLTLLMGLDLPWVADGHQRDGPQVREPVDGLLRTALAGAGQPWQVIYGQGNTRCQNALNTIDSIAKTHHLTMARVENDAENGPKARWGWSCEKCGDADCEHRLFTSLVSGRDAPR